MEKSLDWSFYSDNLPADIVGKWEKIYTDDSVEVASASVSFSLNSLFLTESKKVYYAVAKLNDDVVCVIPLLLKNLKKSLFKFKILKVLNHEHLDVFAAAGQNNLEPELFIRSFESALQKKFKDWDYFIANKWLFRRDLPSRYLKSSYDDKSAFFCLKGVSSVDELISRKLLKNLTRHKNKLEALKGELTLNVVTSPKEINEALNQFYTIEMSGWKGSNGTAIASNEKVKKFYDETWLALSERGNACVFLLSIEDELIASSIAFVKSDKIFLHKICFLDSYQKFGPGALLIKKIIQYAIDFKYVNEICFNTDPAWIQRWKPEKHELKTVHFFNKHLSSFILSRLFSYRNFLRSVRAHIEEFRLKIANKKI